jgi:Xaa-Pro dipeptidase
MERAGVDVAIVTAPRDFHWLTGSRVDFWASESPQWLLIWEGDPIGIVRYLEASTHRCCAFPQKWVEYPDEGPINPYDPVGYTVQTLRALKLDTKRIGINPRVLGAEEYHWFTEQLPEAKLVDFRVERIRVRRSALEVACIRRAVKVNQDALVQTIQEMRPGWSEWGVLKYVNQKHAQALGTEYFRSALGSTCCQVGRHMLQMHAIRTLTEMRRQKIKSGDGVWLEPGVFVNEHVGCMIRSAWFGTPPTAVRRAVDATIEAFERLVTVLAPGKTADEVDSVARSFLLSQGLDFQHRSGYMANEKWLDGGILSLTPKNPLVLEPGQVFHCPMHVHVPGIGYVGVSEQVLVTDTGCEVLGDRDRSCPRQLFIK